MKEKNASFCFFLFLPPLPAARASSRRNLRSVSSGGWIPMLNGVITTKVALGTWVIAWFLDPMLFDAPFPGRA